MQPMLHKLLVSAMFVCAGTSLWAQSVRGTILGTVTDPSGAVVHKAKVTVREVATGLTRSELTSETGEYSIPQLPVGIYDLTVEEPSFKKTERTGIELRVDDRLRIDVALTLGNVAETVQVEAAAPVVSTDSATVGNVVDNKKVTELPLNGRNFLQLNLLVPGATQGVKGSQNQTQGGSITVNGAREQSNNFLLDGMDNNDLAINQYAVAISTEAILEFKVQASTYSAEFGRSPGAQINIATKAGSNQIHGVLYEYLRNNDLDAKNFFDRPGPIPGYKRNQYGTSVGGPIKKNKTFFFGNFEGARVRQGITNVATEPTAAMKNGDFSALPDHHLRPVVIAHRERSAGAQSLRREHHSRCSDLAGRAECGQPVPHAERARAHPPPTDCSPQAPPRPTISTSSRCAWIITSTTGTPSSAATATARRIGSTPSIRSAPAPTTSPASAATH